MSNEERKSFENQSILKFLIVEYRRTYLTQDKCTSTWK